MMKRILNRRDLRTEFGTLFVNCELKDVMDKKVILKYNINTKDCKMEFIKEKIYAKLMKSALSASGYQIQNHLFL